MAEGYLTLEEAAQQLGMDVEELNQMAGRREVRAFADRGTWRFRQKDIEAMMGQQQALQDDEAPIPLMDDPFDDSMSPLDEMMPPPGSDEFDDDPFADSPPAPEPKKRTTGKQGDDDLFEFELSMDSSSFELDAGEDLGLPPAPPEQEAAAGESEVHMVFDDDDFGDAGAPKTGLSTTGSVDIKTGLANFDADVKTSIAGGPSPYDRRTQAAAEDDSGLGDDSSSVGLGDDVFSLDSELDLPAEDSESASVEFDNEGADLPETEEVPLEELDSEFSDSEFAETEETPVGADEDEFGMGSSPFELSEDDLDEPPPPPTSSFEDDDDEVELGELTPGSGFSSGASGINLHSPADTGVGLEKSGPISGTGGDEIEFELSLDADATPAPSSASDDSSEFELTLDDDDFASDEDSSGSMEIGGEERDIFETDVDIPALEDEDSGSEAVALEEVDTDLESSDFDFEAGAEESGSEVMPLSEESGSMEVGEDEIAGVDIEEEDEDELEPATAAAGVGGPALPPANWGALPVVFLAPCAVVLFLLGLMTFEMLHGMWGYKQSYQPTSLVAKPIAELFGAELPKD